MEIDKLLLENVNKDCRIRLILSDKLILKNKFKIAGQYCTLRQNDKIAVA